MQSTSKQFDQIASRIRLRQFAEAQNLLADAKGEMSSQEVALLQFLLAEEMGNSAEAAGIVSERFQQNLPLSLPRCSVLWLADHFARQKEFRCGLKVISDLEFTADDWQLQVQRIRFLALNRHFQEAHSQLQQIWPHIPENRIPQFNLFEARLLANLEKGDDAYVRFKKYLIPTVGHAPLYQRAIKMAMRKQDWSFANKLLNSAMLSFEATLETRMRSAFVHFELKHYQAAITQADQVLALLKGADTATFGKQRDLHMLKCDAWHALKLPFNPVADLTAHLEKDETWTAGKLRVLDCCLHADKTALAQKYHAEWFGQSDITPEIATLRCRICLKTANSDLVTKNLRILQEKWPDYPLHADLIPLSQSHQESETSDNTEGFTIPETFTPKWSQSDFDTGRNFIRGLSGHFSSVHALILRDTRARFGAYKLGFLWAFLEPAIHTAIFVTVFTVIGRQSFFGMSLPLFLITGIIPYMLFRNCFGQMANAVKSNKAILIHPKVQVLDIIVSKSSLEFSTILTVFLVFLFGLYFYERAFFIGDVPVILLGICGMAACGAGLGLITAGIDSVFPAVANLIRQATTLLFFMSGVFFAPEMMPSHIRDTLLAWNPLTQFISMVRNSFTPLLTTQNIDFSYAILFAFALLLAGLVFERVFHFRMQTQ